LHEKSGFWVGDFKYAIIIFKGTKGVAMATKFRKIKAKIGQISVSCKKSRNFSHVQYGFMDFVNSIVLPEFSRELTELPWQPNLAKNKPKLHKFQFFARNLEILSM